MAGSSALEAEIIGCRDEPPAQMMLPEPIDDHSCRQRMIHLRQPACQIETIGGRRVAIRQDRGKSRHDSHALAMDIATAQDMSAKRFLALFEGPGLRGGMRSASLEVVYLLADGGPARAILM